MMGVQDPERRYTLRKRPTTVSERATFVCYTCGTDTVSSLLRLVYCCPNAEREPYYTFIKSLHPFPNASPISPQGEFTFFFFTYFKILLKFSIIIVLLSQTKCNMNILYKLHLKII